MGNRFGRQAGSRLGRWVNLKATRDSTTRGELVFAVIPVW